MTWAKYFLINNSRSLANPTVARRFSARHSVNRTYFATIRIKKRPQQRLRCNSSSIIVLVRISGLVVMRLFGVIMHWQLGVAKTLIAIKALISPYVYRNFQRKSYGLKASVERCESVFSSSCSAQDYSYAQ